MPKTTPAKTKSKVSTKKTSSKGTTKKTKSKKSKVTPEVHEEVPVVETPEPVVETSEPVVETPEKEVAVDASVNVDSPTEVRLEDTLTNQLMTLLNTVSVLTTSLKGVQAEVKTVQKNYAKLLKEHDKTTNKKKRQYRKPSGFAKPSALSEEMTTFLGLDKDVEIARNEVTKLINKYIVDNSLRDESDKRKIQPDDKLATLLNWDGGEQLSYFNLQKYIKHHFVKTNEVAVA